VWLAAALAVVATLGGCNLYRRAKHAVMPQADPPEAIRWNGVLFVPTDTLADTASMPYGTAWMAPVAGNNLVIYTHVGLVRARPGAQFTWAVRTGTCSHDRGIFGPPELYQLPLVADSTGRASANVQLELGFPNRGAYFVRVDAVDSGPPTTLCGTLTPPE
jgi:hypothetical protein